MDTDSSDYTSSSQQMLFSRPVTKRLLCQKTGKIRLLMNDEMTANEPHTHTHTYITFIALTVAQRW